jgi:rare lipoprotein A
MRTAFARHSSLLALSAALLGLSVSSAAPAAAETTSTGGASSGSSAPTIPATEPAAGESTNGGAAPTGAEPGKPVLATWFGPGFYGNKTACGQTMSPKLVGVANRKLPCGTLVHISYHGRSVTVPVVDRGPYGHLGAVWDLTAGTAQALKVKETVRVTTAIVGSLPNTPTLGQPVETPPSSSTTPPANATTSSGTAATGGATAG